MTFDDKFVAFVDILGFEDLVERAEKGGPGAPTVGFIFELLKSFGSSNEENYAKFGPTVCPKTDFISKDLNFHVTQISDCAVISAEVSPAEVINLIDHCYKVSVRLLKVGHQCRGYLTRGPIIHTDSQFIGSGYVRAYKNEKKVSIFQKDESDRGTPFIGIDPEVCSYISKECDETVKKVFGRLTETDGKSTAVTPFFALRAMPDMPLDDPEYKEQVGRTIQIIQMLLTQLERAKANAEDDHARAKIEHYEKKLRDVIAMKESKIKMVDDLQQ